MKVTVALPPEHTVAFEEIETTGSGITVTVTEPVKGCEQLGVLAEATLTKVKVVVAV